MIDPASLGAIFIAERTDRNRLNGIDAGAECRIMHVDPGGISIEVVGKNRNSFPKLRVPRELFGVNFKEDRTRINMRVSPQPPYTKAYR